MVLAEGATQIAAVAPHRQDQAARPVPVQRLFLNGVQRQGSHLAVIAADDPAIFIFPRPAQPCLSRLQTTVMDACLTCLFHKCPPCFNNAVPPQSVPAPPVPALRSRPSASRWRSAPPPYPRLPGWEAAAPFDSPLSPPRRTASHPACPGNRLLLSYLLATIFSIEYSFHKNTIIMKSKNYYQSAIYFYYYINPSSKAILISSFNSSIIF